MIYTEMIYNGIVNINEALDGGLVAHYSDYNYRILAGSNSAGSICNVKNRSIVKVDGGLMIFPMNSYFDINLLESEEIFYFD